MVIDVVMPSLGALLDLIGPANGGAVRDRILNGGLSWLLREMLGVDVELSLVVLNEVKEDGRLVAPVVGGILQRRTLLLLLSLSLCNEDARLIPIVHQANSNMANELARSRSPFSVNGRPVGRLARIGGIARIGIRQVGLEFRLQLFGHVDKLGR